jgi:hypothetical protein
LRTTLSIDNFLRSLGPTAGSGIDQDLPKKLIGHAQALGLRARTAAVSLVSQTASSMETDHVVLFQVCSSSLGLVSASPNGSEGAP